MKNALILHGTNGTPEMNWFRWLEAELVKRGWKVWVPQLPHAEKPSIERYAEYIFSSEWQFTNESTIIGHSAGAVAALGLLEKLPVETVINQAILVGAFKDDLGWDSLTELFLSPLHYDKIRMHAQSFTFLHSDDDPYCPLAHAQYLSEQVKGELIIVQGAKHFSVSTGGEAYRELPIILDMLK